MTRHPTGARTWSVDVFIGERDGRTWAQARLHTDELTSLETTGSAKLNPKDQDVPDVGEDLAVARALSAMSHRLLDTAIGQIEGVGPARVSLEGVR